MRPTHALVGVFSMYFTIKLLAAVSLMFFGMIGTAYSQDKTLTWVGCGISKKAFMKEMAEAYYKKTGTKIILEGGGATKGIRMVSEGKADIGGSCRDVIHHSYLASPIKEERWANMNPVAWDALAVIVHKDNVVSDISLQQIKDLYKGKITNWSQLGGANQPIDLYIRKGKISGVGATIRELIFRNYTEEFIAKHTMPSSGPLEKGIEKNSAGIGITGISSARRRDVKILKLDGIAPVYEQIRDGKYALYRPLYLVTPLATDVKPEVMDFHRFVMSDEGKAVMRKVGTVPHEDALPIWLIYLEKREAMMFDVGDDAPSAINGVQKKAIKPQATGSDQANSLIR
ncbi:MAG: phosphate ABC transporter substrate-binding protein [Arenicellales bacterium]